MSDEYRIPKREVSAEVTLRGQEPVTLKLFLSGQAETHAGYERPSDLLNGADSFLPSTDSKGGFLLIRRDAVVVLSVPAELEQEPGSSGAGDDGTVPPEVAQVEITLDNGGTRRGRIEFVMPEGRHRVQDFLNTNGRFVALRDNGMIHLVNKARIVRVAVV